MLTRLGQYADRILEWGWLFAAVFTPLYFNVYSSRVFEPDKISTLRSLVLIMTLAWLIKLFEGGVGAYQQSSAATTGGRLAEATRGAAERGLPGWLGFLRVPMMLPILVYALAYLISSIFSIGFDTTIFGSYQRLQGTYSQYSYMMLAILVIANLRTRIQADRLINFMLLTSIPVALYGIIQAAPLLNEDLELDPLPWGGDTATRVASTMGNAIFVAAWLIMITPLAVYKLFNGLSERRAARLTGDDAPAEFERTRSQASRKIEAERPSYGWVSIASILGILMLQAFVFFMALKLMAGLPFPDARMSWILPSAILIFFIGCFAIEQLIRNANNPSPLALYLPVAGILGLALPFASLLSFPVGWSSQRVMIVEEGQQKRVEGFVGKVALDLGVIATALVLAALAAGLIYLLMDWLRRQDDNPSVRTYAPLFMGLAIFVVAFAAICFDWSPAYTLDPAGNPTNNVVGKLEFDASRLLWVLFFTLLWGAISAGAYTLATGERDSRDSKRGEKSPFVRATLNTGYGVLIAIQVLAIYLTQSRGPWLGLGVGLAVFFLAMWLVGRTRGTKWMARFGGVVSAIVLAGAVFIAVLNIPGSPLRALSEFPLVGRGVERLSTLFRTEDGTGKVRELIWKGATDLILAEPARSVVGWGPESMYVAYNPYYPAELARWELRNATPDRSHNAEFDQLVTMGAMGLFAYYLVVAAFFFYGIRVLRRVTSTRDQLLVIAILSVMSAHFIEIQTGIQIAATWTYFYLIIGLLVAFGYHLTSYLRPQEELEAVAAPAMQRTNGPALEAVEAILPVATTTGRARAATSPQKKAAISISVARGQHSDPATNGRRATRPTSTSPQQARSSSNYPPTDGKRRQSPTQQTQNSQQWYSSPLRLAVYAILALGVWTFNFGLTLPGINIPGVNSATVRADTIYKSGLNFDGQQAWPDSIKAYREAINIQPDQDYYYLFLGRAWLEFSKQVDNEPENYRIKYQMPMDVPCSVGAQAYGDATARRAEKECRLRQSERTLNRAHDLNPLNSDHYANLGRLYLYWSDSTGLSDAAKAPLAVQNLKAASERTPGNAQLRDELAVAYSRNNQFSLAIETLDASRKLDPTYARTPHLLGQLYQERAATVREALVAGQPLPTDGETDYGKLIMGAGQAYSETIGLDMVQFADSTFQNRISYLLEASKPFTTTNTTLEQATIGNVLTSTIKTAVEARLAEGEKRVADFLRERGVYNGPGNVVPGTSLQALWQDPRWATITMEEGKVKSVKWRDKAFPNAAGLAVQSHFVLGYIYEKTGLPDRAKESYNRMLDLDPNSAEARDALKKLEGVKP